MTATTWRTLGTLFALVCAAVLLFLLRGVLGPVFFAWLLAYMFDPLVDRFEAVRIPRGVGIAILLFVFVTGLVLFCLLVLPSFVRDFVELGVALANAIAKGIEQLGPWLRAHNVRVPSDTEAAITQLASKAVGLAPSALGPASAALQAALGSTASVLGALGTAVLVPVFSFYFLYDFDRIVAGVRDLLPASIRPAAIVLGTEVSTVLGHFVRGQLTVMAILAVLYGVGYSIVGVPLAVPIAVIAGALSFIPYVGSGLALLLGVLMVVLHAGGMPQLLGVLVVYAIVQGLEGFVITPRIVGGKLGLSPVWVLFAVLAFGQLFGFAGVMLALPASAVIKVFVMHGLARYRTSALFEGRPSAYSVARARARLRHRPAHRGRALRAAARRAGARSSS